MFDSFDRPGPVLAAFIATTGTYALTAIGTLRVFFFRSAPRRLMDAMMGFAGGVMVAASCWSLLVPAIEAGGVAAATSGLLAGARSSGASSQRSSSLSPACSVRRSSSSPAHFCPTAWPQPPTPCCTSSSRS